MGPPSKNPMGPPTKNLVKRPGQDCYFYIYSRSGCSKGEECQFRHEPAALKNDTVCQFWLQEKCNKPHCKFRHLEDKREASLTRGPDMGYPGGSMAGSDYGGYGGGRGLVPGANTLTFEANVSVNNPTGTCRLAIMVNPVLTQDKLWKLFDTVPGLQHCEIHTGDPSGERNYGTVIYDKPQAAAYALEKLHGFDYPLGSRVMIKFDQDPYSSGMMGGGYGAAAPANVPPHVASLVSTIQHANQMLTASGYSVLPDGSVMDGAARGGSSGAPPLPPLPDSSTTSDVLPQYPPQPMAPPGTPCQQRLFFVCKETRDIPPPYMIKDLFSRFGTCIEAYVLKGNNCGFAKFGSEKSAQQAINVLDGKKVMGCNLKVMVAEAEGSGGGSNKRPRTE